MLLLTTDKRSNKSSAFGFPAGLCPFMRDTLSVSAIVDIEATARVPAYICLNTPVNERLTGSTSA